MTDYESAAEAGKWFLARGVKNALITLGEMGSVLVTPDLIRTFPAPKVTVVDTTTAAEVFAGASAVCLLCGSINGDKGGSGEVGSSYGRGAAAFG